jgi:hypothetical protein
MAGDDRGTCPAWMDDFTEAVGLCIETERAPMAYDVWAPDDPEQPDSLDNPWVVHFYPSLGEILGGPEDGAVTYPPMRVEVLEMINVFDDLDDLTMSNLTKHREPRYDGSVLDFLGHYQDHPVYLRIFDAPPDDATIDTVIDHKTGRYRPKEPPAT